MTESKTVNELFDTLARILLRCFVLGYSLLLLWFAAFLAAGDVMNGAFGKLFGLAGRPFPYHGKPSSNAGFGSTAR